MDVGSTAVILAATMAVALMIPGLALFYGGMVASRSILNMIMMVFGAVAVVGVLWTLVAGDETAALPPALVAIFQALFAVITTALIAGALRSCSGRAR